MFLRKAGTIILLISIVLWAAGNFPKPPRDTEEGLTDQQVQLTTLEHSLMGRVGRAIEPALKPLGFDWKIGTALIGATAAKEVFVSQLAIVYAVADDQQGSRSLRQKLQQQYHSPLTGFCIMLFCLISAPCVATFVVCKRETGSWRWALFQFFALTALAYVVTLIVYQLGRLIVV